ncbi:ABC transporter permease [Lactovum odontotermitis]
MNLISFELKKFLFDKKTLILMTVFSVLLIGGTVRQELSVNMEESFHLTLQSQAENNIQTFSQILINNENVLSKEKKQEFEENLQLQEKILDALKANDLNKYFDLRYQFDEKELEKTTANNPMSRMSRKMSEQEMKYIRLVKARGLDFEYMPSMQIHAFGKLVTTFSTIFNNLWLLGFAMILTINFAALFENKEIRVYQSLGTKKSGIILKKLFSSVSMTYLWLIILSGLFLVSVGLIKGLGSPNYPAYLQEIPPLSALLNSGESAPPEIRLANMAISNGNVILISLAYAIIILFFLASLGMFLSTLTKRSMLVVGIIAILTEGYSSIKDEAWIQPFRKFVPMSYLDPVNLLKYPAYLFNKNSLLFGVIYLSLLGVVLLFSSYLILKNYRIRRI